jgi:hypothetical protein
MLSARSKAWRTYAAGSKVEHFADFCRTHLVQSEDRWARRVPPSSGRKLGRNRDADRHTQAPKSACCRYFLTPRVRLERTTLRLTAGCSAN